MKQKIIFCILLMLLSSVDVAVAKGKKKKAKKIQRTEAVYEEIDNFDFLYADGYDVNMNFASTDDILNKATSLLGARYRSGSKGPYTFDCSGFTSYVYGQNNISIGCSSRDQYARNHPVDRGNMQRGDLVFFTSAHSGKHVGHVGIVVEVDPTNNTFSFIHASTRNGVIVSRSTDGYYARRFVGVRRVVK